MGGGVRSGGGGVTGWMSTKNGSFCENSKKERGGGGWVGGFGGGADVGRFERGGGGGVRMDMNEELKFL